jgi:2-polyprenyl-3-methyl-5-hydroxy-6-metoxy-1,4-benzoquinol methylase
MHQITDLVGTIVRLNPMQKPFLDNSIRLLQADEIEILDRYITFCLENGLDMALLAQSYNRIVKDTFKEQVYFQRHKRYRYASYQEVADAVYFNRDYMHQYMLGLALSAFLWPNHRELHHFFLAELDRASVGDYLEIGPGHGFYLMQSMRLARFRTFTAVDISPTSVAMTESILQSRQFGPFNHYRIYQSNFLEWSDARQYDFIVMAEVLEHVEQPDVFLGKIRHLLSENGRAFITTCINAPAIDHIYLYTSVEQLAQQITQAGLAMISQRIVPYGELTLAASMEKQLPVNIAMTLAHP